MVPTENGVCKNEIQQETEKDSTDTSIEIQQETEKDSTNTGMKLMDYIPIYIPAIEHGILDHSRHERRFLDFLKARPSKDWFLKFGFVGRLSPFSFLQRNSSPTNESSLPQDPAPTVVRRRFRVPFVRKINWGSLIRYSMKWLKNPVNVALFIWCLFVAAGILMLFLVMTGILDGALPSSTQRKKWTEVINQILNALFMIMCLYQHPNLFHHLVLLYRWTSSDKVEIRKVYCKDGARRPHERSQMMFVVILLHITCIAQYVLCGLYWGYTRETRPDWAVYVCDVVGIASPVIAGVYAIKSPLGRRYDNESQMDQESRQQVATAGNSIHPEPSQQYRRVVVTEPEWIGGLFDCWDDRTVAVCSFFCTFCVFGWNMERLGFGNMYVHIFTFILLCIAPFLIFGASALNIDDDTVGYIVGIIGIVLCLFGLLYGGFWRAEMRKKFKLPGNPFCCGSSSVTDCVQWLFCWSCSLAQEVRTGNFYDIEDDSFCRRLTDEDGMPVLLPLPREGESGPLYIVSRNPRSYSCPPKIGHIGTLGSTKVSEDCSPDCFSITFDRASTYSDSHAMTPPFPPVIQQHDN